MFRWVAIVFSFLALVSLLAHNFIAHKHEKNHQTAIVHHHGDDSSHTHHDEPGNTNDSHNPEFGKYLLAKQETVNFTICPYHIFLHVSISVLPKLIDRHVPLYYISPHQIIPRHFVFTAHHFRGPPPAAML